MKTIKGIVHKLWIMFYLMLGLPIECLNAWCVDKYGRNKWEQ